MAKPLAGMHVALISGFSDAGDFDSKRQENILDYVLRQNVDGLYVGGSSAEGGLMSYGELALQQEVVRDKAKGSGKKLIAHVGQPSVKESVGLAKRAQELGYDALSALPPHAYPFSNEEIYLYYQEVASSTELPLIVYEIPLRTGRATPPEEVVKLLDIPHVEGIKFTNTDIFGLSCIQRLRPDSTYFFGFDEIFGAVAALGIDGGIGTTYNVLGSLYSAIREAANASNLARVRELQNISQCYVEALIKTGVMPGTKLTLELLGIDCGPARAPFTLRHENSREIIENAMKAPGFMDWIEQ